MLSQTLQRLGISPLTGNVDFGVKGIQEMWATEVKHGVAVCES